MRLRRPKIPTLTDAINRYLIEISEHKKGRATDHSQARTWCATSLATRPVTRIKNTDLIALRDAWLKTLAPATVVRRLAFLSHVFTVLRKDWGWPDLANPAELVRRPTVANSRDRRLYTNIRLRGISQAECPRHELDWLIAATRSKELATIMTLAAETAMRRSEICGLQRQYVWLRELSVFLPDTKNGAARVVPLSPWAYEALRQHLAGKSTARGPVFEMSPDAVSRAFSRTRKRARRNYEGLCKKYNRRPHPEYFQDLRFHDLRHEATSLLAPIFGVHELAAIIGNRDTRMVMRYYHPTGRELARKIAKSARGRAQSARIRNQRPQRCHPCRDPAAGESQTMKASQA